MKWDRQAMLKNPPKFDCPPPNFEINEYEYGWTCMARAIVMPGGGSKIRAAARWKKKEQEWKTLPFLYCKRNSTDSQAESPDYCVRKGPRDSSI